MDHLSTYRELFVKDYVEIDQWKKVNREIDLKYVETCPEEKSLMSVYKNTKYIRYDRMIDAIKCLISGLDRKQEYYLLFPTDYPFKIGSENAIILECFDELSKLNI
jgi:hypothetical protein